MNLKMLSDKELEKLNTKRLLGCLRAARAVEQAEQNILEMSGWCCELCKEWVAKESYQEKVIKPTAHLTDYKNRIKKILDTREHLS